MFPWEHFTLHALNQLLDAQHNPESPYYHQWLTPEQFAERFGVSETDAAQIGGWLQGHGMEVEEVTAGRRSIVFSGTAAQVESAFHTQIHTYKIDDELHHANAKDPEIPAALAHVVGGVVSLHDFRSQPMHGLVRKPAPDFTASGLYYLAPADFATIYDLDPLYQQSINGNGQSIAIVGRSNIHIADVRQFRTSFSLPANDPQIIVNGTDPGISSSGEETEADLDVEWSGAVARNATIKFVVSKSTNSSDGVDLSAQYIVNHNLAPVMSTSFGLCEAALGSSGNSFLNSLWQQAASQGISVFVSSGDNGAAGCDSSSASRATHGRGVNGLCSTPYSVCVGGTEFNDASNPALYWSASNASSTQSSALSYIPEVVWNESGPGAGLWSSGGGASSIYPKPSWQAGTGVPADGKRDVPDVSLTAAGHDGYLMYQNGGLYAVGGTSASSPSLAGFMALVVQHTAVRQGNANTSLYSLASKQRAGGASVFSRRHQRQQQRSRTNWFQRDSGIRSGDRTGFHRCLCHSQPLE
jgi:pseudomonalisin